MKNFFKKHDEITKDENDNLKQFDENGKVIIYVYDKDFDVKKYDDPFLDCTFKKHPDSDVLCDTDGFDFGYDGFSKKLNLKNNRRKK